MISQDQGFLVLFMTLVVDLFYLCSDMIVEGSCFSCYD